MKVNKLLLGLATLCATTGFAQKTEKTVDVAPAPLWEYDAVGRLNFSQLALQNWAAGGENSMSLVGFIDGKANYKKGKANWDNSLRLGYGLLKQGDKEIFKSDDLIELNSKYGYKTNKNWFYSAFLELKTQFDYGFQNPSERDTVVSNFFAPAFMKTGLGMDYKPNDNFSVNISPVTMKNTFVLSDQVDETRYGLDAGSSVRTELGFNLTANYKTELMKNVKYETTLALFSNYLENPQNIDVNWSNLITMTVNKYINVNFQLDMIYDDDILVQETADGRKVPGLQLKEVLGIGLTYNFLGKEVKK
ncbi:MAG: DUF3078 domain-containing protein [Flavobacteriales bacterium]|jgi:hypothetical protein|nr:DUF3078 domain-containing protein [Flavobacteriales bacterium]